MRTNTNKTKLKRMFNEKFYRDFFNIPNDKYGKEFDFPHLNIGEDKEKYTLELFCPKRKKEDFIIDIEGNLMTISAEQIEESKTFFRREYKLGSFSRSVTLPENSEWQKIEAKYSDGVLTITIPKNQIKVEKSKSKINVQ